jgi:hypothetical protein
MQGVDPSTEADPVIDVFQSDERFFCRSFPFTAVTVRDPSLRGLAISMALFIEYAAAINHRIQMVSLSRCMQASYCSFREIKPLGFNFDLAVPASSEEEQASVSGRMTWLGKPIARVMLGRDPCYDFFPNDVVVKLSRTTGKCDVTAVGTIGPNPERSEDEIIINGIVRAVAARRMLLPSSFELG